MRIVKESAVSVEAYGLGKEDGGWILRITARTTLFISRFKLFQLFVAVYNCLYVLWLFVAVYMYTYMYL